MLLFLYLYVNLLSTYIHLLVEFHFPVILEPLQLIVFIRTLEKQTNKLTSTCQFSAITLLTGHSCGLLLSSPLPLTLQSSEREQSLHLYAPVHVRVCVYVCTCSHVPVCIRVCLHVSETRHDLVSGEGLGSPSPVHSRPDSAAELINISVQSKVGSATRPQGCTN